MEPIDPQIIEAVRGLQLSPRWPATGLFAGLHRSIHSGSSTEFAEHRRYIPGDDARHIDWRAYAKTNKLLIKRFEDETNLLIQLLLDASGSMNFAGDERTTDSKFTVAQRLLMAIAYIALEQGDRVGLSALRGKQVFDIPARSSGTHLASLSAGVHDKAPEGRLRPERLLEHLTALGGRRRLVFMFSDFFTELDHFGPILRRLRAMQNDVVLMQVLHPEELEFPYDAAATFEDLESDSRLYVYPQHLRGRYMRALHAHQRTINRLCAATGAKHFVFRTNESLPQQLRRMIIGLRAG